MVVYYKQFKESINISGKTYPYRDVIKSLGGRFNSDDKSWSVPTSDQILFEVKKLCKSVGGGPAKAERDSVLKGSSLGGAGRMEPSPPPRQGVVGVTVPELMAMVHETITTAFKQPLWVLGELQDLCPRRIGFYFKLAWPKDEASKVGAITANVTLWRSTYERLVSRHRASVMEAVLQDGLQVRVLCQVSFYKDRGELSLNVLDVDPDYTKGSMALERERLLQKLRREGLDGANKDKVLTRFPLKVGLISAADSRAKSDFLDQLRKYAYPGKVIFYAAHMQGEALLREVRHGVKALTEVGCDLIVLTRGGGSLADLRWFDTPQVAYAIANCEVPIVAAIGHHDDICIAEEICFHREKTPTAAADFIIHTLRATEDKIASLVEALGDNFSRKINDCQKINADYGKWLHQAVTTYLGEAQDHRNRLEYRLYTSFQKGAVGTQKRLDQSHMRIAFSSQDHIKAGSEALQGLLALLYKRSVSSVAEAENTNLRLLMRLTAAFNGKLRFLDKSLDSNHSKLYIAALKNFEYIKKNLSIIENKLTKSNPVDWMQRGWTLLNGAKGEDIRSVKDVSKSDIVAARLPDGVLTMRVVKKELR